MFDSSSRGGHDWSAMGLLPSKQPHGLHGIKIHDYQEAIDWLKQWIAKSGQMTLRAELLPEREVWKFYITEEIAPTYVLVPHEFVRRLQGVLDWVMFNKL